MGLIDTAGNIGKSASYGSVLSSVSNIGGGVGGIIKKIKSLAKDQKEPSTIRDLYTNGFLSQESQFVPHFFTRTFDEPTYLTFRVEFNFDGVDNEHRNTMYNENATKENEARTLYNTMYDYMPEPLFQEYKTTKGNDTYKFNNYALIEDDDGNVTGVDYIGQDTIDRDYDTSIGRTYSTEFYLDVTLGEHGRAILLQNFIAGLKDIQYSFPYYLKSIGGLGDLFKVDPTTGIRLRDAKITLDCYEALDLRITQLLNTYKKIAWDDVYQRWILPDMMRYFNMKIYISEIRLFHDFIPNKPKNENFLYDFSNPNVRNATVSPLMGDKDSWWEKGLNALNTANSLSNTFLGTKSHLTKAINTVSSTIEVGKGLYNDIAGAITDLNMCNSTFNEIMPTICIDCHMCEFDISDIMDHVNSLKSSTKESPNPKIVIKVGNAKDIQVYPLNASLKITESDGYAKTIDDYRKNTSFENVRGFASMHQSRKDPNGYMFAGNYIVDDALTAKYIEELYIMRQNEYLDNLMYATGHVKGETIANKRMNYLMRNDSSTMKYPRGYIPQDLAKMSLTTAGIQEAQSFIGAFDKKGGTDLGYIIGTHSTATAPDKATRQAVEIVGDTLLEALDKFYNGPEITSTGLPDEVRNDIAYRNFAKYMDNLHKSYALSKDSITCKIIDEYNKIISNAQFTTDSSGNIVGKDLVYSVLKNDSSIYSSTVQADDMIGYIDASGNVSERNLQNYKIETKSSDTVNKELIYPVLKNDSSIYSSTVQADDMIGYIDDNGNLSERDLNNYRYTSSNTSSNATNTETDSHKYLEKYKVTKFNELN